MKDLYKRKRRCHNCLFSGTQFKIANLTHLHCQDPKQYTQEKFDNGEFCAWDSLRVFSDTCDSHRFKKSNKILKAKI